MQGILKQDTVNNVKNKYSIILEKRMFGRKLFLLRKKNAFQQLSCHRSQWMQTVGSDRFRRQKIPCSAERDKRERETLTKKATSRGLARRRMVSVSDLRKLRVTEKEVCGFDN